MITEEAIQEVQEVPFFLIRAPANLLDLIVANLLHDSSFGRAEKRRPASAKNCCPTLESGSGSKRQR